MYEDLKKEAAEAFEELLSQSHFRKGSLIVIGGSSSEIRGGRIGKDSSYEVGTAVVETLMEIAEKNGLRLAFQCCEHLNRALIVERETAEKYGYEEVTVCPGFMAAAPLPPMPTTISKTLWQWKKSKPMGDWISV